MKFCKDCIHYRASAVGGRYASCWRNVESGTITGGPKPKYCELERNWYFGKCGKSAKFFEPIAESSPKPVDNKQEVNQNPTFIEQVVKFFKRSQYALISEGLSGQISNLQDKLSMMFNEIGSANKGVLQAGISVTSDLIENYETVEKIS